MTRWIEEWEGRGLIIHAEDEFRVWGGDARFDFLHYQE